MIRKVNDRTNELSEVCEAIVDYFNSELSESVQRRCVGTCLASDVDDIVQETFWRFWQALIKGRLEGLTVDNWKEEPNLDRIGGYLCGIATNVRREFYRRKQSRKSVELPADACAPAVSCPVALSEIQAAIQQCRPTQREAFLLKQEGWSTAEIATKQDVRDTTVRTHLARARGRLKEILKDYDVDVAGDRVA